jgi:YfiH family protein
VVLVWQERVDGPRGAVVRALTGRDGGASVDPYRGLNLGDHVGDSAAAVAANRAAVASAAGVEPDHLLVARQVHGRTVAVAAGPWGGPPPEADALVTATPGLVLAVLVADCVPVMLVAPAEGVVAVAHAGRRGMVEGVVDAALAAMRGLGATRVLATVGPSVCARCYEVPPDLRDEVAAREPVAASVTRTGTPSVDVAAGVLEQLARAGVAVTQVGGCTAEDPGLYSYRRAGVTGRFAGLVWLQRPGAAA